MSTQEQQAAKLLIGYNFKHVDMVAAMESVGLYFTITTMYNIIAIVEDINYANATQKGNNK